MTRVEDVAFIDGYGKRLHLIANDSPKDAVDGAQELLESICRTVLRCVGATAPAKTADLAAIAKATLAALELGPPEDADARASAAVVRRTMEQLSTVVTRLADVRNPSPRHARLAVGAAVTFAAFIAETYVAQAPPTGD